MEQQIDISIPMPLIVIIEDVGWWSGKDGSGYNQPFRTGMPRDHVPDDYKALAAFGKGLDMRVLAGFILCEWDKENILKNLPSATWMGRRWNMEDKYREYYKTAASIIKREKDYIEFGLHGVGHEFWQDGKMDRSEFHNSSGQMRDPDEIRRHLAFFYKLMDQHGFDFQPRTFIPPALKHSFGNCDQGFQKILSEFGIEHVTLIFDRSKLYRAPQTRTIGWENNILLVERGEADVPWHVVSAEPVFKFDRPVMALHWANILDPDPEKNLIIVDKWVRYIKENAEKNGFLLSRDTSSCFTQYIHKVMSKIEKKGEEFVIDMSWKKKVPENLVGESLFLKIYTPSGVTFKVYGADVEPCNRSFEQNFVKFLIPKHTTDIYIKPITA